MLKFRILKISKLLFHGQLKEAELASGSTAATASQRIRVTVATLGPTAAIGVATTFGVASQVHFKFDRCCNK